MGVQKTNREKYLDIQELRQENLNDASLRDLHIRLVKALKTPFKCQRVIKDQILHCWRNDLKVKIVWSKKKKGGENIKLDHLTRNKLFVRYFW